MIENENRGVGMRTIFVKASDETIKEILALVKTKDWIKDVKIISLDVDEKVLE